MNRLIIEKMSKGGFVVYDGDGLGQGGMVTAIHAATDIADALAFIGDSLAPVESIADKQAPASYCTYRGAAHCSTVSQPGRCKSCPHDPLRDLDARAAAFKGLRGEVPAPDTRDMFARAACSVCGSLHAESYCARQTCPGKHRKLYEPAADGSVNWAG